MPKQQSRKSAASSKKLSAGEAPPLPTIARLPVNTLSNFVRDDREEYQQFLAYVRAGATPGAAAACVGLADATWRAWFAKYREGERNPLIRKFGSELETASGMAAVVAETSVAKSDAKGWLKGPARKFLNNDWETINESSAVPSTPQVVTNNTLIISPQVQQDALKALEEAGLITVNGRTTVLDAPASSKD